MHADIQTPVRLLVYGLGPLLVLMAGYFGWRKIRPHCRRYGPYEHRASERKKFWGYE
jgi:hypothetical protein